MIKKGSTNVQKQSLSNFINRTNLSPQNKNEIIPNIEINLNKFSNTKIIEEKKNSEEIRNTKEENTEDKLLANVKVDIDNLKNRMKDTFSEKFLRISSRNC